MDETMLDFWGFIRERQSIWWRRQAGLDIPPWTSDPILRDYWFTNVFRELDPGTRPLFEIMGSGEEAEWRLFNASMYRRINVPGTWAETGGLVFGGIDLRAALERREASGEQVFTNAWQVRTVIGPPPGSFIDRLVRLADEQQPIMNALAKALSNCGTFRCAVEMLRDRLSATGTFMAYQLAQDLTYGSDPIVRGSVDEWAPIAGGASWGMSKVRPDAFDTLPKTPTAARGNSTARRERIAKELRDSQPHDLLSGVAAPGHERLTLSAIEHSLCEYGKYWSLNNGLGRHRRYRDA